MSDTKIVAVFFGHGGVVDEDGVKVLCRVPAGTIILGAELLTVTPCIVLSVPDGGVVERIDAAEVEEWPTN